MKRLTILLFFMLLATTVEAGQMRSFSGIKTPGSEQKGSQGLTGAASSGVQQVPGQIVIKIAREFIESWNTPGMGNHLSPDFYDKSRLLDNMEKLAPREAILRLQSVQGIQTLEQSTTSGPKGEQLLVSRVSATVMAQIEYNDPNKGFQRVEGTFEIFFNVTLKKK